MPASKRLVAVTFRRFGSLKNGIMKLGALKILAILTDSMPYPDVRRRLVTATSLRTTPTIIGDIEDKNFPKSEMK